MYFLIYGIHACIVRLNSAILYKWRVSIHHADIVRSHLCRCVVGGTASTIPWLETSTGAVDTVVTSQLKAAWSG